MVLIGQPEFIICFTDNLELEHKVRLASAPGRRHNTVLVDVCFCEASQHEVEAIRNTIKQLDECMPWTCSLANTWTPPPRIREATIRAREEGVSEETY